MIVSLSDKSQPKETLAVKIVTGTYEEFVKVLQAAHVPIDRYGKEKDYR